MSRVRICARLVFALGGLALAFGAFWDTNRVDTVARLSATFRGTQTATWELLTFSGLLVTGASLAGSAFLVPRPKWGAVAFALGAAAAVPGAFVNVTREDWSLFLGGSALLALLAVWMRKPACHGPRCPRCGEDAEPGDRFCAWCGRRLTPAAESAQAVVR